jgi:hypothetical protein
MMAASDGMADERFAASVLLTWWPRQGGMREWENRTEGEGGSGIERAGRRREQGLGTGWGTFGWQGTERMVVSTSVTREK